MTQNLIKGKDVIGLKVVTLDRGKSVDSVEELVYDPKDQQVKALIIDEGGWFSEAKVILFEDIHSIGKDAIIISSESVIKKASDVQQRITRIVKGDNFLTQDKIVTEDGTELGQVSDIYFDATTGIVSELEVSQGLKNLQSGKKRVRVADIVRVGEDVTIVRGYVEERLEKQAQKQGVQGAMNTAKEQAPSVIDQVKTKAHELTEAAKEKVQEIKEHPKTQEMVQAVKDKTVQAKDATQEKVTQGQDKTEEMRKNSALGTYVTITILSKSDAVIAKPGDMVTHQLLGLAKENGALEQVLANTTKDAAKSQKKQEASPSTTAPAPSEFTLPKGTTVILPDKRELITQTDTKIKKEA